MATTGSTTTFGAAVNRLLVRFNEIALTSSNFTSSMGFSAQAREGIQSAQRDILQKFQYWPFLQSNTSFTTSSGTSFYTLAGTNSPIDWDSFQLVRNDSFLVNGVTTPLVQAPIIQMDYKQYLKYRRPVDLQADSSQWSLPRWVVRAPTPVNSVYLTPIPFAATLTNIMTITYDIYTMPSDPVNFGDVLAIPDQFINVLIDCATVYCHAFKENEAFSDRLQSACDKAAGYMLRQIIPGWTYAKDMRVIRPRALTGPARFF